MKRRSFMKLTGLAASTTALASPIQETGKGPRVRTSGLVAATADEHRQRLKTLADCKRRIRRCLRRHLVQDYLPGQASYNLGEYPCREPWDPNAEDERILDELGSAGVELLQVHEEWNDSQRIFGATKFTPLNQPGFRRFVQMVHSRGMKLLVYVSTGYFERTDPDFRPEWARRPDLVEIYFRYAGCSPVSPGWRAYVLPKLVSILDEYGVDGLYDDLGRRPLYISRIQQAQEDILAFEETKEHDGALEDFLGILYGEVKKRGGIFKVHSGGATAPNTGSKVYDYLWVGEAVSDVGSMREKVKNHEPYVVPCLDMSRARIEKEDDLYLHSIPYMQFPLLLTGRPFTGERALIPGIEYPSEDRDFWTRHCRNIWRYYQEHKDGPFSYGWWDSCPGRPEARPTYFRWLKLYRPMVKPGTWAYLEVTDSDLFDQPLPSKVVATVFANQELYLVLANYSGVDARLQTRYSFVSCMESEVRPTRSWKLPGRQLLVLKRTETNVQGG